MLHKDLVFAVVTILTLIIVGNTIFHKISSVVIIPYNARAVKSENYIQFFKVKCIIWRGVFASE